MIETMHRTHFAAKKMFDSVVKAGEKSVQNFGSFEDCSRSIFEIQWAMPA